MSTLIKTFFILLVFAFSGGSFAALITSAGNNVQFTYDDSLLGLFGLPTVSGDSLVFAPTHFTASREASIGGALTQSNFVVKIDAINGHHLAALALNETGDYLREGAKAGVAATGTLNAVNLNAAAIAYVSNILPTTPFAETFFGDPAAIWTAKADLNLSPDTSSVMVNIDSILRAKIFSGADGSDSAFIEQNWIRLQVTAIPLPLTVWLFGGGLMWLLSISKRNRLF